MKKLSALIGLLLIVQIALLLNYTPALAQGNDCATATLIDVNVNVYDQINPPGEVDYFYFTLPAAGNVGIYGNMDSGATIKGYLYNSTCSSLLASRLLTYPYSFINCPSLPAGTYRLKIEGLYYLTTGTYWIYVAYDGPTTSPEMDVTGNGYSIPDGDTSPDGADNTFFDYNWGYTHTFTIVNTGSAALNLTGTPLVSISGTHAGDFTVTQQPNSPVEIGDSTTFQVVFQPNATGLREATISIASNDSNENPYNFAIAGESLAVQVPEITLRGNGQEIIDGDTTPTSADDTDFGVADVATGTVTHTFTIANSGSGTLNLTGTPHVSISGPHANDFSVSVQPGSPVEAGETTTFDVRFDPNAEGLREAVVSIDHDDSDKSPYDFAIQGTGTALDTDGDGLSDIQEQSSCTDYLDADTDDDGIIDGDEDINHDGVVAPAETDPCNPDSDSDGIQDGTELGYTLTGIGPDTDTGVFIPDADPSTATDPTDADSDNDGYEDGQEDLNFNGRGDFGEADPLDELDVPQEGPIPTVKLLSSDGAALDYFGYSVAISGDVAIVGAYDDDDNGTSSGSAYVFRRDGSTWVEEQKLLASDGAENDYFGYSVAISGGAALVGAYRDDDSGTDSGSVYVFRWNGSTWVEEQKLLASDGAENDYFGYSVAISGDVALLGAYGNDDDFNEAGSVYVFRWNGNNWVEEQKILPSDSAGYARFGYSVSISGDVAAVGAHGDDGNGSFSGSVYVFRQNINSWVEEAKLIASDGAGFDYFGHSVSISKDVVLVGAYRDDDSGTDSGSAYVFRWNGSNWVEEQKILPSDGAAYDNFGYSVAISGEAALVGAYRDDGSGTDSGSAYVFRWSGSNWVEEQKLLASDGAESDYFGYSIAMSGHWALVGTQSNTAYMHLLSPLPDTPEITVTISNAQGYPGQTEVLVPLSINDATGVAGVDATITFDPNILSVSHIESTQLAEGFTFFPNINNSTGKVTFSMAKAAGIPSGSGALVNIYFDVSDSAVVGTNVPLVFENVSLFDENAEPVSLIKQDGLFQIIEEGRKGDVNKDENINSADAILCLRIAVSLIEQPTEYQWWAANANHDASVNSADAILILKSAVLMPTIFYLDPKIGSAGTQVRIMGWNFGDSQGTGNISFNGAMANAIRWSHNEIITTAPSEATTGPVVVTVDDCPSNSSKFTLSLSRRRARGGIDTNTRYSEPENRKEVSLPDDIIAAPNQRVIIPIDISDAADIAGMDTILNFDPNILVPVDVETTALSSGFTLIKNLKANQVIISLARATGIVAGSGAMVNISFDVPSTVSFCDSTALIIESLSLFDENAETLEATAENGLFTVCPSYPHAESLCINGQCVMGTCEGGWQDLDGDPDNGCEYSEGNEDLSITLDMPSGWSMISLPVDPIDQRIKTLFPEARAVFEFTNKYVLLDPNAELETGKGYWICLPAAGSYSVTGIPIESYTISNASSGWSMIGACTDPSTPSVDQGTIRAISGFSSEHGFIEQVDPLQPGKGYWINLSEEATLTVE